MAVISETNVNPQSISIKDLPLFYSESLESYIGYIEYVPTGGSMLAGLRLIFALYAHIEITSTYNRKINATKDPQEIKDLMLEKSQQYSRADAHVVRAMLAYPPFLGSVLLLIYDTQFAGQNDWVSFKLDTNNN